jgi:dTDP-glucose 4,6-dehydratase
MRYFVTGGAGFIGSNYIEHLFHSVKRLSGVTIYDKFTYASNSKNYSEFTKNPKLRVINGDICDPEYLVHAMKNHDFVIHFAAESHVDRSINSSYQFVKTNVLGTLNVLEACRANSIKTLIHVSTDEVYGSIPSGSADENHILKPNSPYAATKAASDLLVKSYHVTHGLDIRITRSCNNYGKYQFPEKVIPVFIKNLTQGQKIPIYGNGENIREWIHVSDHCRGIQTVLEKGSPGEIYNIGSGQSLSNNDLALLIIDKMGLTQDYKKYVKDRLGHDYRYSINSSKINKIGFQQLVHFEIGITETIAWYFQNQNWWGLEKQDD